MKPELIFTFFDIVFQIKSYTLFTILGALIGVLTALPFLKREGLSAPSSVKILILMALSFLIGARLFNFVINPSSYGKSLHIFSMRLAGLSVYGGILGAIIALLSWSWFTKTGIWKLLDAFVLPFGIAFALARIGCYLNGCCIGIPTDSFFGVAFPTREGNKEIISELVSLFGKKEVILYFYPTQLFEMGLALFGLIQVMWLYFKNRIPQGAAFLLYGILFSAMRLLVLPLRSLPYSDIVVKLLYPLFYITLIGSGIVILRGLYKKIEKNLL